MLKNKKNFYQKKYKGVTLLELIVVIAIISIVSAISFSTLSGMRESAKIEDACNEVAALINKTKNYALTGKKFEKDSSGGDYGEVPEKFVIVFENDKNYINIQEPTDSNTAIFEKFTLPVKISVTPIVPGRAWCDFEVPDGKGGHNYSGDIKFKKSDGTSSTQKVVVSSYGGIATCQ